MPRAPLAVCFVLAGVAARADAPAPGSVGHYSRGSLVGGAQLPEEGADFYALFPDRCYGGPGNTWGNPRTIAAIADATAVAHARHPDAPRIAVGEISGPAGGEIPQHLSHQNGLDVDVLFWQRGTPDAADAARYPIAPCTPYGSHTRYEVQDDKGRWGVSPAFELPWNWSLAAAFAERSDVRAIFVGPLLEKALGDWARDNGVSAAERRRTLAKLMPVFCAAPRHVKLPFYRNNYCPHDDHFHVRFACPAGDTRCRSHR